MGLTKPQGEQSWEPQTGGGPKIQIGEPILLNSNSLQLTPAHFSLLQPKFVIVLPLVLVGLSEFQWD